MNRTGEQRGQYSRISNIELAKVTHEQMTRAKALQTLGLNGIPTPKLFDQKTRDLLAGNENMQTTSTVHAAHSRLQKDHQSAVDDMRKTVDEAYTKFQSRIDDLIDRSSNYEKTIKEAGKKVIKISRSYCETLKEINADIQQLETKYKEEFTKVIQEATRDLPEDLAQELNTQLATLEAKIKVAYAHVLEKDAEQDLEDITNLNPVDLFKAEFNYYLQDLLQIQSKEQDDLTKSHQEMNQPLLFPPRYQNDLKQLHNTLSQIGERYFAEIKVDGADIQALQKQFTQDFKQAVDKAQHAFAKEPGIWANLSCTLKFLAIICLCIPAIIIIYMEKPEDRHRLFQGAPKGEMDINTVWKEWQMDIFPDPEGLAPKRNRQ